eukprot:c17078_g1_i1.p1 GENE.c17078_g1_i1~~c17078_g1_i1.p1  ORF type:complete len:158 (+),score=13.66 c17078_g1_i1:75-548(+)
MQRVAVAIVNQDAIGILKSAREKVIDALAHHFSNAVNTLHTLPCAVGASGIESIAENGKAMACFVFGRECLFAIEADGPSLYFVCPFCTDIGTDARIAVTRTATGAVQYRNFETHFDCHGRAASRLSAREAPIWTAYTAWLRTTLSHRLQGTQSQQQ